MKLSNLSKRLLQDLFKSSEGLFIFTLYRRFKVSPKELFMEIKDLEEKNIIFQENGRISLTTEGKNFAINSNIIPQRQSNKFDKIQIKFLGRRIQINEFYLPSTPNIQKELLT